MADITQTLSGRLEAASNTAGVIYLPVPSGLSGNYQLVSINRVSNLAISAHDTDYRTFTVYGVDGSTAQATRATTVAGGATVAGTGESLTPAGGANAIFLPGDEIKITSGGGGTEPADSTQFVCIFKLLR